jgi:hypothetical protein
MEIANSPFLHYAIKIRTELKIEIKDFAVEIDIIASIAESDRHYCFYR